MALLLIADDGREVGLSGAGYWLLLVVRLAVMRLEVQISKRFACGLDLLGMTVPTGCELHYQLKSASERSEGWYYHERQYILS